MNPLSVTHNDYRKNKKNSTVFTPVGVAQFLFDILQVPVQRSLCGMAAIGLPEPNPMKRVTVFDPAIGSGRLTDPWFQAGHHVIGCDIDIQTSRLDLGIMGRFEDCTFPSNWPKADIVLCNSPFNGAPGKQLYPEVFLRQIFNLLGPEIPVALFVPMGFLLNQRRKSKRWRWLRDIYPQITSIISLPLDIFEGVEFHNEILIFNVDGIQPHYFLPEEAL